MGQRTTGLGPPQEIIVFVGDSDTALTQIFAECLQTWLSGIWSENEKFLNGSDEAVYRFLLLKYANSTCYNM